MLLVIGRLARSDDRRLNTTRLRVEPTSEMIHELVRIYREVPDPGVHSAAEWALRRFGKQADVVKARNELASTGILADRQWYVTSTGHTMVVIPGPTQFMMGTSPGAGWYQEDEARHPQAIPRSFSIASHETTVEQFARFLQETPELRRRTVGTPGLSVGAPHPTTWYEAAAYCNWLSQQEQIPSSQWCYVPNASGNYAEGMRIAGNVSELRGYRLPTEAEWEYACRAGSTTIRHFGSEATLLKEYAAYGGETKQMADECGERMPNDFGLFDTHGNVAEWCQDNYQPRAATAIASQPRQVHDQQLRVHRGGSYQDAPLRIRSGARGKASPKVGEMTIGFRIARSYP